MAEGWLKHLRGDDFEVFSAGLEAHGLNPLALRAMQEVGVDISQQRSQLLDELPVDDLDYVLSVCGHADHSCPELPGSVVRVHVGFDDPPKLAAKAANDDEAMPHYRRVRDEIKQRLQNIDELLP